MKTFDNYGARQEPVDDVAIAKDWQDEDVFKGDTVYFIDGELVLADDLEDYTVHRWGKVQIA